MFKHLKQPLTRFLWLGVLTLMAISLFLLLNRPQEPASAVIDTPTLIPAVVLTETPTLTPTLEVTPTPIPGDNTIPIDAAPTGELLLYQAWQKGAGEKAISSFHVLPLDSGEGVVQPFKVTFGTGFDMYINSVSPDGRYTLLLKDVGSVIGGLPHIYDRETGEIKSFFEDSPSVAGLGKDWSFDNKKVLFWSGDIGGLWLLNAETGEKTLLTAVGGSVQGASISPSGEQIVFIDTGKKAYNALWMVDAGGGDPQWQFDIESASGVFGWTPTGILFLEGDPEGLISLVKPGSDQRLKLDAPVDSTFGLPTRLSPDRTKLTFSGTPDKAPDCTQAEDAFPCLLPYFDVYVLDILENKVINLGEGIYPEWSPTGQEVAFVSFRTGKSEVWVVNIDGSNLRQVSNDGLNKSQAFWLKGKDQ